MIFFLQSCKLIGKIIKQIKNKIIWIWARLKKIGRTERSLFIQILFNLLDISLNSRISKISKIWIRVLNLQTKIRVALIWDKAKHSLCQLLVLKDRHLGDLQIFRSLKIIIVKIQHFKLSMISIDSIMVPFYLCWYSYSIKKMIIHLISLSSN